MSEQVNHPSHYNAGKIEAIDVIEDWKLNFNLGCVLKYICRADYKNTPIEDLEKASWYLTRELYRRKNMPSETKTTSQKDHKGLLRN